MSSRRDFLQAIASTPLASSIDVDSVDSNTTSLLVSVTKPMTEKQMCMIVSRCKMFNENRLIAGHKALPILIVNNAILSIQKVQ